jgi:hypothetical protein
VLMPSNHLIFEGSILFAGTLNLAFKVLICEVTTLTGPVLDIHS